MNAPDLTLRSYRHESDAGAVITLLQALNQYEAQLGAPRRTSRDTGAISLEDDNRKIRLWGGQQMVALLKGEIIGYIAMTLGEASPIIPEAIRKHVFVENLIVAEGVRHQGVGQALLMEAEGFARLHGFHAVCLGMVPDNLLAERLYAKAGFKPVAIEMRKVIDEV